MRRPRAFSLLELLVAIALGAALLGALFSFFWQLLRVREELTLSAAQHREASLVVDRLERELMTVITADPTAGTGVRGDATSVELLSRGVAARLVARDSRAGFGNVQGCAVRFDAERSRLVIAGGDAGATIDPSELTCAVEAFQLRYHDGTAWRETFDSAATGHLPLAVEIAIWFGDADDSAGVAGENSSDDLRSSTVRDPELDDVGSTGEEPQRPPDRFRVVAVVDGGPAEDEEGDDAQ